MAITDKNYYLMEKRKLYRTHKIGIKYYLTFKTHDISYNEIYE